MTDDNFRKHNYRVRTAIDLLKTGMALEEAEKDGLLSECERKTFDKMVGTVVTAICNAMAARCGRSQHTPSR
jgi:hypothetical protein